MIGRHPWREIAAPVQPGGIMLITARIAKCRNGLGRQSVAAVVIQPEVYPEPRVGNR